jgi:CRISPR-associated protein Csm2
MSQTAKPVDAKSKQEVRRIVEQDDPRAMVSLAEIHGKLLHDEALKSSQIRPIFGMARAIEGMWVSDPARAYRELLKLRPKLAYQAQRIPEGMPTLRDLLDPGISAVGEGKEDRDRAERFQRFLDYFEAVLAYHRAAGGK